MNKGDLIEAVSREADLSKAAATRAVDSVLKTIVKTVSKKQTVIPSLTVPKFTPGAGFKEKLAKR
ncbi:MAG: hypothetical protein EBV72_12870 [Betaproteobacteria bacterium]|nr:hypothetical protein [Betaproteobacteria bacterium]